MDKWIGFRWASCSKKLNIPKKSTSLNYSLTFFLLPFKLNLLLDSHWMKSLLVSTFLITACNSQAKQYFSQTIFESNVSVGFQFVHLQVFQFFIVVYDIFTSWGFSAYEWMWLWKFGNLFIVIFLVFGEKKL